MDILGSGHEQVVFCSDQESGLRAVIAVHSTALGPALGGTRFYPYASESDAVADADALRLSRAMSYKNSLAGLDLDVVARETRFAHGRSLAYGGCGDSSVLAAYGVFQCMRAAAAQCWGEPTLRGRTVAVAGVGKVGSELVELLVADGAELLVADVDPTAVDRVRSRSPRVRVVADTAALVTTPHDVYAPCALGGALDEATVAALPARIVCGGANNQLDSPGIADRLAEERMRSAGRLATIRLPG